MAVNPLTTKKVSDWFATYNAPTEGLEQGGSGVLGASSPVPPVLPAASGVLASPKVTTGEASTSQVTQGTGESGTGGPLAVPPVTPVAPAPELNYDFRPSIENRGWAAPPVNGTPATTAAGVPASGVLGTPATPAPVTPATPAAPATPGAAATPATPGAAATPATPGAATTPGGSTLTGQTNANGTTTITPGSLTRRVVDPATETVQGRLESMPESKFVQDERARAVRTGNQRGMLNSTMSASAGEEAAIRAGLPIATADAGTYNAAANYNAALSNQALMYNVDTQNQFQLQANTIAGQRDIANLQAATSMGVAGINAAAQLNAATLNAENQRFIAQMNNETSRYNTDTNYRNQQDQNRITLTNNIINNTDLSPDRKAELLRALGQGALANAIYVPDPEITVGTTGANTGGTNPASGILGGGGGNGTTLFNGQTA